MVVNDSYKIAHIFSIQIENRLFKCWSTKPPSVDFNRIFKAKIWRFFWHFSINNLKIKKLEQPKNTVYTYWDSVAILQAKLRKIRSVPQSRLMFSLINFMVFNFKIRRVIYAYFSKNQKQSSIQAKKMENKNE